MPENLASTSCIDAAASPWPVPVSGNHIGRREPQQFPDPGPIRAAGQLDRRPGIDLGLILFGRRRER